MHNYVIVEITRTIASDGKVVYGGDQVLWLNGYIDDRTFANTLPRDIGEALWDYQQECDIEGFHHLDREFIFGEEQTITLPIEFLQTIISGLEVSGLEVDFHFRILPRNRHTCKVEWRCGNQTGILGNVAIGSTFYERLNGGGDE